MDLVLQLRSKSKKFFHSELSLSLIFLQFFPLFWRPEMVSGLPGAFIEVPAARLKGTHSASGEIPAACFRCSYSVFPDYPRQSSGAGLQGETHHILGEAAIGFRVCMPLSSEQ